MKILILSLLGLCFGSFVNAFVWRFHELEGNKKLSKKQKSELSIIHGRSICTHCRHELAWYDLLPVISWLSLKGKCRYCHKPISWQYPVVEISTAVLFVVSYLYWPYGLDWAGWTLFGLWLVFLVGFMALIVYDLRWMLLPNRIVYALIALSIAQVVPKAIASGDTFDVVSGAFWGFATIGLLFYVLFQVSKGKWIGGGDVKLAFMIGILVGGPINSMLVLFISSVLGTVVSLPLMANKKLKISSRIPFGPFLLLATIIVYIFADRLSTWYLDSFL
jgi:prepilin signal peptidase PulO-like enzyme (type II secretory pathway)